MVARQNGHEGRIKRLKHDSQNEWVHCNAINGKDSRHMPHISLHITLFFSFSFPFPFARIHIIPLAVTLNLFIGIGGGVYKKSSIKSNSMGSSNSLDSLNSLDS